MDESPDPTPSDDADPEPDMSIRDVGLEWVKANWVWLAGVAAVITGFFLINTSVWMGLLGIACGAATLVVTRAGQEWASLPAPQKVLVAGPGIVLGFAGAAVVVAAAALAVVAFHILRRSGPIFIRAIFTNDYYKK